MKIKIGDWIETKHHFGGFCVGILKRSTGKEYQISYLMDDELRISWIYKDEIESICIKTKSKFPAVTSPSRLGFRNKD